MNYRFNIKRIGNHWYVDLNHNFLDEIALNRKCERVLNLISNNSDCLEINLIDTSSIINYNTVFFNEEDILRFFTTDDDFNIRFTVNDHEFSISSKLYSLIETDSNPNFHKYLYDLYISNRTV